MSENLLTKCPHCGTTFRLTQAQLDIAGGAVRCGACYQVFHAAEHIVKTTVVEEHRTVSLPPDPVEEAFDMKSDEGMDPYDSDDLEMDSPSEEVFSEEYRAKIDQESKLEEFGYQEEKPKKKDKSDESWAEELLKELGDDEDDHRRRIYAPVDALQGVGRGRGRGCGCGRHPRHGRSCPGDDVASRG